MTWLRKPCNLILVRHGITDWNAQNKFQGQTDVPLNVIGRAQAAAVGDSLRNVAIDVIYTSDLSRASDTAAAIAAPHGLVPIVEPLLREFDFGKWEGLTWEEIVERYPASAARAYASTSARAYAPEGGETFAQVRERAAAFFAGIQVGAASNIAIVTHAGVLHAMLSVLLGKQFDEMHVRFAPASITRLSLNSRKPKIVSLNEVAHLL